MKPFECDSCGGKIRPAEAAVCWNYDRASKRACHFAVVHQNDPGCVNSRESTFNRRLPLEYVFKYMPEFICYIKRLDPDKKKLRDFVHRIEKDRSYIRRHTVDKKVVRRLIIRLEGADAE